MSTTTHHCIPPCTTGLAEKVLLRTNSQNRSELDSHPYPEQLGERGNERHRWWYVRRKESPAQRPLFCWLRLSDTDGMENVIPVRHERTGRHGMNSEYFITSLTYTLSSSRSRCSQAVTNLVWASMLSIESSVSLYPGSRVRDEPILICATHRMMPLRSMMKVTRASPNRFWPVRYAWRAPPFSSLRIGYYDVKGITFITS